MKRFFWVLLISCIYLILIPQYSCRASEEHLALISKIDISGKYFYDISSNGEYLLINVPKFTKGAAEYDPGGKYKLYNISGELLWERQSKENIFFTTNNTYLVQALNMEFKSPRFAKVLTLSDFTVESTIKVPEKHIVSMDVDRTGRYYILGEDNGNIMIIKDGGIIWQNTSDISSFTDVAFSEDGKYFMESLNERLFKIDGEDVKDIKADFKISNMQAKKDVIDIYFNQIKKHYQYIEKENTIYFIDKTDKIDQVKLYIHSASDLIDEADELNIKYDMNLCIFAGRTENTLLIFKNDECK